MLSNIKVDNALITEQRREFENFGYLVLPNVLDSDKVNELLTAFASIRPSLETSPHRRNPQKPGLNIRPIIDKHPAFLDLLLLPSVFPTVVGLLNHFNIQLTQSNLIEALPSANERLTGWHSDGGMPALAVNGIRAFGSLKVGYCLRDLMSDDMGSLMVVPGSHRLQGDPPFPPGARDPVGAVQLKLRAGDAVVFHQGVWHASAPNLSNQNRLLVYYGYGYRILRPVDYQKMPDELLERCSPVERQLLGETVTHEGYYLPTDDDVPLRAWFDHHFADDIDRGDLERVNDMRLGAASGTAD